MTATPRRPLHPVPDVDPQHPAWDILEAQGLTLHKITVLVTLLANDHVHANDVMTMADCILDVVATAERQRDAALETLKRGAA